MNRKGFLGILGFLLTVAIICVIGYLLFTHYLAKPTEQTQKVFNEVNLDPANHVSVFKGIKSQVQGIESQIEERAQTTIHDLK